MKLHGFARESVWRVVAGGDGQASVTMQLANADLAAAEVWGAGNSFVLNYTVALSGDGSELSLELSVENTGASAFTFTACLHTYIRFDDSREVALSGLGGCDYIDKCDGRKVKTQGEGELVVVQREAAKSAAERGGAGEGYVDRIYKGAGSREGGGAYAFARRGGGEALVSVAQTPTFADTTVYNPWLGDKQGDAFPDFDDDGYLKTICVEPTLSKASEVTLAGGEKFVGGQTVTIA